MPQLTCQKEGFIRHSIVILHSPTVIYLILKKKINKPKQGHAIRMHPLLLINDFWRDRDSNPFLLHQVFVFLDLVLTYRVKTWDLLGGGWGLGLGLNN